MSPEQTTMRWSPGLLARIEANGPLTQADLDRTLDMLFKPRPIGVIDFELSAAQRAKEKRVLRPTLAMHKARADRNGLSRWTVKTPRGKRALQLQAYKGRLYLYGQMVGRPRGHVGYVSMRYEAPLGEIIRTFGKLYPA